MTTPKQKETLEAVRAGKVYAQKFGYGAWRTQGASGSMVGRMVKIGFVVWGPIVDGSRCNASLTLGGRQALELAS